MSMIRPPVEKLVDSNIKVGEREGTIIDKGIILNEYLVSPFINVNNLGPNPIENSITFTPFFFANTK